MSDTPETNAEAMDGIDCFREGEGSEMSAKNIKFRVRVKPNAVQPICKIVSVASDREKDRNECELWSELFAKEINKLFKLKEEA